jgi:hypothetical protein
MVKSPGYHKTVYLSWPLPIFDPLTHILQVVGVRGSLRNNMTKNFPRNLLC